MLTTGTVGDAAMRSRRVVEDPGGDHGVVARHDPGDVLDRLARVEADLLARVYTGWPPSWTTAISIEWRVRFDGFSKISATPCPARGVPSVGRAAPAGRARSQLVGREVGDVEQVAAHGVIAVSTPATDRHAPRRSRRR